MIYSKKKLVMKIKIIIIIVINEICCGKSFLKPKTEGTNCSYHAIITSSSL